MNKQNDLPEQAFANPRQRYLNAEFELFDEAFERGEVGDFSDALALTVAAVMHRVDNRALTGDILYRIGSYLVEFDAQSRAAEELSRLRKEGAAVN